MKMDKVYLVYEGEEEEIRFDVDDYYCPEVD